MKAKQVLVILLTSMMVAMGCKKDAPNVSLPAITHEGKNTFGCKVDGQVWTPSWPCQDVSPGFWEFYSDVDPKNDSASLPLVFSLNAGNERLNKSLFSFQQAPDLYSHLIYHAGNIIDSLRIQFTNNLGIYLNAYSPYAKDRYFTITTLDTVNKIVAGEFAFTVYGAHGISGYDSVVITEGRFDLQIGDHSKCSD